MLLFLILLNKNKTKGRISWDPSPGLSPSPGTSLYANAYRVVITSNPYRIREADGRSLVSHAHKSRGLKACANVRVTVLSAILRMSEIEEEEGDDRDGDAVLGIQESETVSREISNPEWRSCTAEHLG